jgi:DNA-binding CsgD family transcriptional regulator
MADLPTSELSERELEILKLLATGASNKDIAQQLYISTNTVKVHLRNIFYKISVTTRTEAAMYAVHKGLVTTPNGLSIQDAAAQPPDEAPGALSQSADASGETELPKGLLARLWKTSKTLVLLLVLVGILGVSIGIWGIGISTARQPQATITAVPLPSPTPLSRWLEKAKMPTMRRGLAAAVFEDQIYVIGGDDGHSVTGLTARYDPPTDAWQELANKPLPVTDVSAAVLGGLIYVPGGRTAAGVPVSTVEVYDPGTDRWNQRANLPIPISGYALAAYEGRLYIFGGWDGKNYLASVYDYDPSNDHWTARTPMLTARAFAGAAASGGKIFVLGGFDGINALSTNERYTPSRENGAENPWSSNTPLPAGRYGMGVVSIADIIYVLGGEGERGGYFPPLQYKAQQDLWANFDQPLSNLGSHFGLVSLDTRLYLVGGQLQNDILARNLSYQALFTIVVPVLVP